MLPIASTKPKLLKSANRPRDAIPESDSGQPIAPYNSQQNFATVGIKPSASEPPDNEITAGNQAGIALGALIKTEISEPTVQVTNAVIDPETGATLSLKQLLRGKDKDTRKISHSDEWGRLTQGNGRVKGTETCFFVKWATLPKGVSPTYL